MKLKEIAKIIYFRDRDSSIGFYDSGNNCHFTAGSAAYSCIKGVVNKGASFNHGTLIRDNKNET